MLRCIRCGPSQFLEAQDIHLRLRENVEDVRDFGWVKPQMFHVATVIWCLGGGGMEVARAWHMSAQSTAHGLDVDGAIGGCVGRQVMPVWMLPAHPPAGVDCEVGVGQLLEEQKWVARGGEGLADLADEVGGHLFIWWPGSVSGVPWRGR